MDVIAGFTYFTYYLTKQIFNTYLYSFVNNNMTGNTHCSGTRTTMRTNKQKNVELLSRQEARKWCIALLKF